MITEQQIIDILNLRESNIDGGETLGIHCVEYGNVAKAILKAISTPSQQPVPPLGDELVYWRQRCIAAEVFIKESPCDPDITKSQINAYTKWQELNKNFPDFVPQEVGEFLDYVKESRDLFSMYINSRIWDNKLRTECESLLICFDQMKARLSQAPLPEQTVQGYSLQQVADTFDAGAENEYEKHFGAVPPLSPNKETYLASLQPAPTGKGQDQ